MHPWYHIIIILLHDESMARIFSVLWLSYASKRTNERTRKSKICTHTHTILAFEFIHPELRIIRLFIWHKRKRHILLFKFIFNLSVVCFNSGACVWNSILKWMENIEEIFGLKKCHIQTYFYDMIFFLGIFVHSVEDYWVKNCWFLPAL